MSNLENQTQMRDLLQVARERGYLLVNELDKVLPASEETTEELDELFSVLERDGVEVYADAAEAQASSARPENAAQHNLVEEESSPTIPPLSTYPRNLLNSPAIRSAPICARWALFLC